MDLVPLVAIAVVVALCAGELARRTRLGNRMDGSFETLKGVQPEYGAWDQLVMVEPPVAVDPIAAMRLDPSPMTSTLESSPQLTPPPAPLHAQAS